MLNCGSRDTLTTQLSLCCSFQLAALSPVAGHAEVFCQLCTAEEVTEEYS